MHRTYWSRIGIVLAAILVLFVGSAPAYAQAGTGPEDGLDFGAWRTLDFNTEQWMCFDYAGDNSRIRVDVFTVPSTGVDVCIRTPGDMDVWRTTGDEQCVGRGTVNPAVKSDLHWAGSFNSKGTYCVTVAHNRGQADPVYYSATITGDGVRSPQPAAVIEKSPSVDMTTPAPVPSVEDGAIQPAETQSAETQPAETQPDEGIETALMTGDGPETALMADGTWRRIEAGEKHWYRVPFRKDGSIEVSLSGSPADVAEFTVRTADQVEVWRRTGEEPSVGRGTLAEPCGDDCVIIFGEVVEVTSEAVVEDLFWAGSFNQNGTVWVVVESRVRQGDAPGFYRLAVGGAGVDM